MDKTFFCGLFGSSGEATAVVAAEILVLAITARGFAMAKAHEQMALQRSLYTTLLLGSSVYLPIPEPNKYATSWPHGPFRSEGFRYVSIIQDLGLKDDIYYGFWET